MLNAHWAHQKAISSFTEFLHSMPALAATVESLVMDVRYPVLIHFSIITKCSKGAHYFHRVVGLVVLSMSVLLDTV